MLLLFVWVLLAIILTLLIVWLLWFTASRLTVLYTVLVALALFAWLFIIVFRRIKERINRRKTIDKAMQDAEKQP